MRIEIRMAALCVSACAFALVASGPVSAAQTAEEILGQAELYTVKITALNSIGLNQDSGGTAGGAGFLIDKARQTCFASFSVRADILIRGFPDHWGHLRWRGEDCVDQSCPILTRYLNNLVS